MEYKNTLNITLNDKHPGAMPQRASLPTREPEIQRQWDEMELYRLSVEKASPKGTFILHDGPPYSNGNIHLGHALNKIAKDIIVKYKTMQGYCAPYIPGWDNHGMPIENEVSKVFRKKGEKPDKVTMRKACREYASRFVDSQKLQFKRLGVRGDWSNPYLTMSSDFEASIVKTFGQLAESGYVYRGLKPVMWCPSCETALADAEIEYDEHTSSSIFVRFPVHRDPNQVFGGSETDPENAYVVIWTTTPWTIPANLALAVHPDSDYVVVEINGTKYLAALPLVKRVVEAVSGGPAEEAVFQVHNGRKGFELEGLIARHPLFYRTSPVVMAPYVTMEDGTGIVHTAPGHGKEDFETGVKYGLEILCPVGPDGAYTKQAGEQFFGKKIPGGGANTAVLDALKEAGHLLKLTMFQHSYPHCWRCHNPLLFRATVQWFMNIDHKTDGQTHRQRSLDAIQKTQWVPPVSINRINSMVQNRPDWCLSRQRAWGVGIPAFYCRDCGKEIINSESIDSVVAHVLEESSDVWYAKTAAELLPEGYSCPHCNGTTFDKETDILDVWFDSGSSHYAVLENTKKWPLLKWPADVYLEGTDQHRGWFNSSLMVGVGTRNRAPFDTVITNGFTVDENGRKMSKSLGNVVDPLVVMEKYGADIIRLWVAYSDYFADISCSDGIIESVSDTFRRIRNTFRFLVNNLYVNGMEDRFNLAKHVVAPNELQALDQWVIARLAETVDACRAGYESYEFHRVYHAINNFCSVDLSAFYLDVVKDRIYCSAADSPERLSALTAIYTIAETMAKILAPLISHTSDEVWKYLGNPEGLPSAQLADFPEMTVDAYKRITALWRPVLAVREVVNVAVETARNNKVIGNPLEAALTISAPAEILSALSVVLADLPAVLKVSQVELGQPSADVSINVSAAVGTKCARCWLIKSDVGEVSEYADLCLRCADVVAKITV